MYAPILDTHKIYILINNFIIQTFEYLEAIS